VRDRWACLERRHGQLRALVESWTGADRGVVLRLVDGAQWLAPIDACADAGAAPPFDPELFDPQRRVALLRVHEALASVRAATATGAHARGIPLGQATLALTIELGDGHASVGEAHLALGEQLLDAGRIDEGNAHIDAALQSSIVRDDAAMLRDAAAAAARGAVAAGRDPAQVLQLVAIGRAALGRTDHGSDHDDAAGTLDLAEAAADLAAGQVAAASVALGAALERRIAARGDQDLRVTDILVAQGGASIVARRFDDALAHQRRALTIREDLLGAAHPRVASSCAEVAAALVALGRADEARGFAERALAIQERAFGGQDPRVADALSQLGAIEAELGHIDLALASHRRALAIREQSADVPELVRALDLLGSTLVTLGRWDEADAVLRRALELGTTGIGARPVEVATTRFLLGRTAHGRGDFAQAIVAFTAAFESRRTLEGATASSAITQVWLARAQRDSGDLERAKASALAALARLDPPIDPEAWAHARLVVADALWAQGETGEAVAAVTEAITVLRASTIVAPGAIAMLEAWRTARSAPEASDPETSDPEAITIDP
jgi:tetratricopeptide (TPR) repeat protein